MPLMAWLIFTRGSIDDPDFRAVPITVSRTNWYSRWLDWFETKVKVTITFKKSPTNEQVLAVQNALGSWFGHKNVTRDGKTLCIRMARWEFCHLHNREIFARTIVKALYDERLHRLRVA